MGEAETRKALIFAAERLTMDSQAGLISKDGYLAVSLLYDIE